jgi:hypothetical protein
MSPLDGLRQKLLNSGTDAQQLQVLRHVLAGSEEPKTLKALAVVASELADYVADDMLGSVGDLKDHIFEKLERLGVTSTSSPRRARSALRNLRTTVAPQTRMVVTKWVEGADGILSREIYADPDGPTWRP